MNFKKALQLNERIYGPGYYIEHKGKDWIAYTNDGEELARGSSSSEAAKLARKQFGDKNQK
jgi:hypothetical protein